MTETITTLIQWLIPSGSLATVIVWLTNKVIRNARTDKEVHDIYKKMYDDVKETMLNITKTNIDLQNEVICLKGTNTKLLRTFSELKRILSNAAKCKHYDTCPVRDELHVIQGHDSFSVEPKNPRRQQRGSKDGKKPDNGADSAVEGRIEDTDAEPP